MGQTVTQTRVLPQPNSNWRWIRQNLSTKNTSSSTGNLSSATSDQTTTSYRSGRSELPDPPEKIPTTHAEAFEQYRDEYKASKRRFDTGHPFTTTKRIVDLGQRYDFQVVYNGLLEHWQGPIKLFPANLFGYPSGGQTFVEIPAFDPAFYGPRAISATSPTNSVADLAVLLGELRREGLPKLGGTDLLNKKVNTARSIGGEYLNVEFGWKPLVAGLADTMYAVAESKRLWDQYKRDSGKWVRRSYVFPTETLVNDTRTNPYFAGCDMGTSWNNIFIGGNPMGRFREDILVTRDVYFKGAFTYHLPDHNESSLWGRFRSYTDKAQHLLGLELTPEVVWNLAPWSWLSDWDGNIGANIGSLSNMSQDSLVLVYGYLMCETRTVRTFTMDLPPTRSGVTLPAVTNTYTSVRKERIAATPYGFGRNPDSFTSRQWSILAALGLAKSPRSLKVIR